ncbi:hypothetical protein FQZ97_1150420 [compost metagenome]
MDAQQREAGAQFLECARHQRRLRGRYGADAQQPGVGRVVGQLAELGVERAYFLCPPQRGLARRIQGGGAARAIEEREPQRFLEALDLAADGRLREADALSRCGEGAVAAHGDEGAKLGDHSLFIEIGGAQR